jgi:hypothetical protein
MLDSMKRVAEKMAKTVKHDLELLSINWIRQTLTLRLPVEATGLADMNPAYG